MGINAIDVTGKVVEVGVTEGYSFVSFEIEGRHITIPTTISQAQAMVCHLYQVARIRIEAGDLREPKEPRL